MECVRSITFTIPGKKGEPAIQVAVTELDGKLVFDLSALDGGKGPADLRGLFFDLNDDTKLAGLQFANDDGAVTGLATHTNDLGRGANVHGKAAPFDVGLEFGTPGIGRDHVQSTSFTLSNDAGNLTLDDIANVLFGARTTSEGAKLTVFAPAAPDAVADAFDIFEDGQSGVSDPSKVSNGVLLQVLANDTDADGDTLTITSVHGAQHGIVEIVDGDDADSLVGDAVLYTPDLDYAGADSFTYCVSDNNGGTDFADVQMAIEAVADKPVLSFEVAAGAAVNQILLTVTATQNDADGSEFIDRIDLSGLPSGVTVSEATVNPGDEPGTLTHTFVIDLPLNQDASFDLGITAYSQETSNGDQESTTINVPILFEHNLTEVHQDYLATNQSIWSTGDQLTFMDDRFLGINESWNESGGGFIYGATNGNIKAGFQSTLTFEGGEIDATVPYDISIDTNYNKTTDTLMISGDAALGNASFVTDGPEGSYVLDMIFNFFLHAEAGMDFGDVIGSYDVFSFDIGPTNNTVNVLNLDSDDASITLPLPADSSLTFAWPNLDTTSNSSSGNVFSSEGESNNFLQLDVDADAVIFALLGLPNPFGASFDFTVGSGSADLLDLDLMAGLNFLQEFAMTVSSLTGTILYENGVSDVFDFGADIVLQDASDIDVDNDGLVEFALNLAPDATLHNNSDLGFNVGYQFDVLKAHVEYGIPVTGPSGSVDLGPVFSIGGSAPVASVGVYDDTFDLAFASQEWGLFA
jgi:hypothetical protein